MKKSKIILVVLGFLFFVLQVILIVITFKILEDIKEFDIIQKKNVLVLLERIENVKNELYISNLENFDKITASNKELYKIQGNTLSKANMILSNTKTQVSQANDIKQTYDAILDEQKKKTVDISKTDSTIEKIKVKALTLYDGKDYLGAYYQFKSILSYEEGDSKIRALKIKSLYYSNPANSSHHEEILEDMKNIFSSGEWDSELEAIRSAIKKERGETNE